MTSTLESLPTEMLEEIAGCAASGMPIASDIKAFFETLSRRVPPFSRLRATDEALFGEPHVFPTTASLQRLIAVSKNPFLRSVVRTVVFHRTTLAWSDELWRQFIEGISSDSSGYDGCYLIDGMYMDSLEAEKYMNSLKAYIKACFVERIGVTNGAFQKQRSLAIAEFMNLHTIKITGSDWSYQFMSTHEPGPAPYHYASAKAIEFMYQDDFEHSHTVQFMRLIHTGFKAQYLWREPLSAMDYWPSLENTEDTSRIVELVLNSVITAGARIHDLRISGMVCLDTDFDWTRFTSAYSTSGLPKSRCIRSRHGLSSGPRAFALCWPALLDLPAMHSRRAHTHRFESSPVRVPRLVYR